MKEASLDLAEGIDKEDVNAGCNIGGKKHIAPDEKDENIGPKINKVITISIVCLLLFVAVIYINDKTGIISEKSYKSYKYSNGESEFDVWRITYQNYVGWQVQFFVGENSQPYVLDLRYDPLSIEDVAINRGVRSKIIDDTQVYITWDPGRNYTSPLTMAGLELIKVIPNKDLFKIPVKTALTSPYKNSTVKSCKDAASKESVIYMNVGLENKISLEGDCILLEGKTEEDLVRVADRLVLYLLGIMK